MQSRDFCYWLKGFFELNAATFGEPRPLDIKQVKAIEQHLDLVFIHEIDPSMGDPNHQAKLNAIHNNTLVRC